MKHLVACILTVIGLVAQAGSLPRAVLETTATNLVVTETATATIHLYLDSLPKPYNQEPPILNQRPPHVEAAFLEQDWKPGAVQMGNLNELNAGVAKRGRDVRYYTLNNYVSNDIFSQMRDPFSFFNEDPFESLGPKPQRFPFACTREKEDGHEVWHYTIVTPPIKALAAGSVELAALKMKVYLIASISGRGQARLIERTLVTPPLTLTVSTPPAAGRPAGYSGAIGSTLAATASLDSNICTAGDPLVLTLDLTGDADFSRVTPPDFTKTLAAAGFRFDAASAHAVTRDGAKRFTWRIRALKAGTFDFPELSVGWYDRKARSYRTANTAPVPVQVRAGRQAALTDSADTEEENAFPMPDGLDLDFPAGGTADFTLHRALALATRAAKPADFEAAAKAYTTYLEDHPLPWKALFLETPATAVYARHYTNLGALRFMAGKPHEALAAWQTAERIAGASPSTLHGLRAAYAKLRNNPRADLPLQRELFAFWYKFALRGRILSATGLALGLALIFFLAAWSGRRLALILLCTGLAYGAQAQFFRNFGFGGGRARSAPQVQVSLRLQPSDVLTGEPFAFVFELDLEKGAGVEDVRVSGMPDATSDHVVYGDFETLTEQPSSVTNHVIKRLRLPARFLAPFHRQLNVTLAGMVSVRTQTPFGTSSFSTSFGAPLKPFTLDVKPLPTQGRPDGFTGAIGRNFTLRRTLSSDHVRPGDLVTATYTLNFDGYFPTNALPRLATPVTGLRTYPPKEMARTQRSVTWQQVLVPESITATNTPALALDYYDLASKRYRTVQTDGLPLTFVSKERASTENTSVTVNATPETAKVPAGTAAARPLALHFAPSEASPILFTLPPGTAFEECARNGSWRRITTVRGIGWIQ